MVRSICRWPDTIAAKATKVTTTASRPCRSLPIATPATTATTSPTTTISGASGIGVGRRSLPLKFRPGATRLFGAPSSSRPEAQLRSIIATARPNKPRRPCKPALDRQFHHSIPPSGGARGLGGLAAKPPNRSVCQTNLPTLFPEDPHFYHCYPPTRPLVRPLRFDKWPDIIYTGFA